MTGTAVVPPPIAALLVVVVPLERVLLVPKTNVTEVAVPSGLTDPLSVAVVFVNAVAGSVVAAGGVAAVVVTVAVPVMVAVLPPTSVTAMLIGSLPAAAYVCEPLTV